MSDSLFWLILIYWLGNSCSPKNTIVEVSKHSYKSISPVCPSHLQLSLHLCLTIINVQSQPSPIFPCLGLGSEHYPLSQNQKNDGLMGGGSTMSGSLGLHPGDNCGKYHFVWSDKCFWEDDKYGNFLSAPTLGRYTNCIWLTEWVD